MVLEGTPFATMGSSMFGNIFSSTFIVLAIIIIFGIVVGVAFYVRYIRQFNIQVMILSTRSGGISSLENNKIIFDKGAVLHDKQNNQYYFRLYDMKVDLPVPPFDVLQMSNKGNLLKVWQKSNDEFIYLLPDKIDKEIIMRSDGKKLVPTPVGSLTTKQVEGDISYWNTIRKRQNRKMFDSESMIMKLLPYIIPVLMFMLVIFMTWMVIKKFDVLSQAATALENAANALSRTTSATVVTG